MIRRNTGIRRSLPNLNVNSQTAIRMSRLILISHNGDDERLSFIRGESSSLSGVQFIFIFRRYEPARPYVTADIAAEAIIPAVEVSPE